MATGMSAETGRALGGSDHLRQSVRDVLLTPVGSRVMRRDYGSRVPDLLDSGNLPAMRAAAAEALARWEPRIDLSRVTVRMAVPGHVIIGIEGVSVESGEPVRIEAASVRPAGDREFA